MFYFFNAGQKIPRRYLLNNKFCLGTSDGVSSTTETNPADH